MPTAWLALAILRAGRAHGGSCHTSNCIYYYYYAIR